MTKQEKQLEQFCKERDEVLLSLDEEKIREYACRYCIPIPSSKFDFWGGVHKAILHLQSSTLEQKIHSKKWLEQHGFSTEICE